MTDTTFTKIEWGKILDNVVRHFYAEADWLIKDGIDRWRRKEYADAIQSFQMAESKIQCVTQTDKEFCHKLYFCKGYCELMNHNLIDAAVDFELAVAYSNIHFYSYYVLGNCYYRIGQYACALENYSKVLEKNSKFWTARRYRAYCNYFLYRWDDVVEDAKKLLKSTESHEAIADGARLLHACNKDNIIPEEAKQELIPESKINSMLNQAADLIERSNPKWGELNPDLLRESIDVCTKVLFQAPLSQWAMKLRAKCFFLLRRHYEALNDLDFLDEDDEDEDTDGEGFFLRAQINTALERYPEAEKDVAAALKRNPHEEHLKLRAEIRKKMMNFSGALEDMKKLNHFA